MMMMISIFTICIIISMMMMMMCMIISKKMSIDRDKSSPFECGFSPLNSARLPFSIQFFLIAVLFLIFDIEIALMLPIILTLKWVNTMKWLISVSLFMFILMIGLFHEWKNGVLEWK
uniref:NADH dehydrogenase subunit 3 n=1 Tax=Cobbenicoris guangxiensis TaxID=3020184 RepID=UPI002410C72F|nr:NADH dehydrogenase subunit 3 [Cobbenicoris guangxiensis]WEM32406.1 NADH dehydrogenase subunit 3 [Cobbenicoris guangxiensis]